MHQLTALLAATDWTSLPELQHLPPPSPAHRPHIVPRTSTHLLERESTAWRVTPVVAVRCTPTYQAAFAFPDIVQLSVTEPALFLWPLLPSICWPPIFFSPFHWLAVQVTPRKNGTSPVGILHQLAFSPTLQLIFLYFSRVSLAFVNRPILTSFSMEQNLVRWRKLRRKMGKKSDITCTTMVKLFQERYQMRWFLSLAHKCIYTLIYLRWISL